MQSKDNTCPTCKGRGWEVAANGCSLVLCTSCHGSGQQEDKPTKAEQCYRCGCAPCRCGEDDSKPEKPMENQFTDVRNMVSEQLRKTELAFGGCKKCYGKGYATVLDAWSWHDTDTDIGSPGGRGRREELKVKFCTCDRGKQLEALLATEYDRGYAKGVVEAASNYATIDNPDSTSYTERFAQRLKGAYDRGKVETIELIEGLIGEDEDYKHTAEYREEGRNDLKAQLRQSLKELSE